MSDHLTSADGRFSLYVQGDGNLVLYRSDREPWEALWSSGTARDWSNGPAPAPPMPDPVLPFPPPPNPQPIAPTPQPISPSPALDRLVRVTDERDGELLPRMYSYWSNAVILSDGVCVFAGHADGHPRFFGVRPNGSVERLGSLLPYMGTAEGWSWDAHGWIYLLNGPELRRVHPFTGDDRLVFSIRETHPGCRLWQAHSSDDGQTHSATVEQIVSEGPYPRLGTVVSRYGEQLYYEARGTLDESQITPDGAYLVIKEDDDNCIVTLDTGDRRIIPDAEGAVGHSDCGPGILVGEFSHGEYGECVLWDLRGPLTFDRRRVLFQTWNMGHVSIRNGVCLLSDRDNLSLVALDGSGMRPFLAHGSSPGDYDHQVKANLDPTGRIACYMSDQAGRRDVYLTPVPR